MHKLPYTRFYCVGTKQDDIRHQLTGHLSSCKFWVLCCVVLYRRAPAYHVTFCVTSTGSVQCVSISIQQDFCYQYTKNKFYRNIQFTLITSFDKWVTRGDLR